MVRFDDYVTIYHHTGDIYNPFADYESIGSDEMHQIEEEIVYDGPCKIRITSGYNLSDKLKKANYTVSIPVSGEDLECFINERDTAMLKMKGTENKFACTVIEFIPYSRNCILYLMLVKNGEEE